MYQQRFAWFLTPLLGHHGLFKYGPSIFVPSTRLRRHGPANKAVLCRAVRPESSINKSGWFLNPLLGHHGHFVCGVSISVSSAPLRRNGLDRVIVRRPLGSFALGYHNGDTKHWSLHLQINSGQPKPQQTETLSFIAFNLHFISSTPSAKTSLYTTLPNCSST